MNHYYYFAATLPGLALGKTAPFSSEEFLARAARQLDGSDLDLLREVSLMPRPEEGSRQPVGLFADYCEFEGQLRAELVRLRARRLGRRAEDYLPKEDGKQASGPESRNPLSRSPRDEAHRVAALAFQAQNPLEGELVLERERWAFIEGKLPFQSFDLDSLVAYRLKLLILERLASFSAVRGEGEYRKLYDDILSAWTADAGSKTN